MFNFKSQAENELSRIEHLLENLPKTAERPKGSLIRRGNKTESSYSLRTSALLDDGSRHFTVKNLGPSNSEECIAFKEELYTYLLKRKLTSNAETIRKLISAFQPYDLQSLNREASELYEDIPLRLAALESKTLAALNKWANEDYERPPRKTPAGHHLSLSGRELDSKSEVIIANILESYGIPYRNSPRIALLDEDRTRVYRYPDFVFLTPKDEFIYWEHLGLLRNADYASGFVNKIQLYTLNDILPGKNLILTADSSDGVLDSQLVVDIIETTLLRHFR